MTKHSAPKEKRSSGLAIAVLGVVFAAVAFGAAFYLLDGASLVGDAWNGVMSLAGLGTTEPDAQPPLKDPDAIALPAGMPEQFALRLWQEQLESQANIEYLVQGDVKAIAVRNTAVAGDESISRITVTFRDGSTMPGELGMRKFGDAWYVAWVRGDRGAAKPIVDESDEAHLVPAKSEVDTQLLGKAIGAQTASKDVLSDYALGKISKVEVLGVTQSETDSKVVIGVTETSGTTYEGTLEAVKADASPEPIWILAGFTAASAK